MNDIEVPQGSDKTFEIICKDVNDNVVDFTVGYQNIVVLVLNKDGSVLDKWSRTATAGWITLDVTDQNVGKLLIKLLTATTKTALPGKKYLEVRAQKTDATVGDGAYDSIVVGRYVCTIVKSVTSTITLP